LEVPPLLREIFEHEMQLQSSCELLRDPRQAFQMLMEPPVTPDIVILGLTDTDDATLLPALFAQWPRAQVMTITKTGADAAVYELQPRRQTLTDLSPAEIVDTLRQAVERRRDVDATSTEGY
jgi:DNA-binding NarL/FixJ family response regulator